MIILAAGSGTRFGQKKQFVEFQGEPLWKKTYKLSLELVSDHNIVVVGVDIEGGKTRTGSVSRGLEYLKSRDIKQVAIVEAARPLLQNRQLYELISTVGDSKTFVKPLVNTVIGKDKTYYDRDKMYELLTPQCFNYEKLREAYDSNNFLDMTDDTRIMWEYHRIAPVFIEGGENLLKVTYPKDIHIINQLAGGLSE